MKSDASKLERAKHWVEIAALILAGLYFVFKWGGGWLQESVSLGIETSRIHAPSSSQEDILVISVSVENGTSGSLRIYDAALQITVEDKPLLSAASTCLDGLVLRLEGITRQQVKDDKIVMGIPHDTLPQACLSRKPRPESYGCETPALLLSKAASSTSRVMKRWWEFGFCQDRCG